MYVNIQGRHLSITPALNNYVKEKLKKIKYYFDHIIYVHVVLHREHESFIAEGTITAEYHHFHNRIASGDMYHSINTLMEKLERQIRRYKEHVIGKKRHVERKEAQLIHSDELHETKRNSKVEIKEVPILSKPMDDLEAILQFMLTPNMGAMAFLDSSKDTHPSYLILDDEKAKQFSLIRHDRYWERLEVLLNHGSGEGSALESKLEYVSVESLKPSLESIEDAIDFLSHNKDMYRFFTSVRTLTEMLLYRSTKQKEKYSLLCKLL